MGGETREGNGEMNIFKVHCIQVWKCHNETHYFLQLIYTNKKKK
jgi:hypothetical protein